MHSVGRTVARTYTVRGSLVATIWRQDCDFRISSWLPVPESGYALVLQLQVL